MSAERIALIQRFHDSWNQRELDAALDCIDPNMEFDWSASRGPFSGIYTGRDGIRRFWADMLDTWEEFQLEVEEMIPSGPVVITANTVHARGKGSGIEVNARGAMLWKVRGDKIVEGRFFQTKDEALAAVAGAAQSSA